MKRLKGLIRMEHQPALASCFYFLFINVVGIMVLVREINREWSNYLTYGMYNIEDCLLTQDSTITIFMGYIIGILMLIYAQFRNDKSIEISRFMKALPYTNGEKARVKLSLGILSFTVPFIIYVIAFMIGRGYAVTLYHEIYHVTAFEEIVQYLTRPSIYLSYLGMTYLKLLMIYLLFMMFEYLMSHNIGSIVSGVCVVFAPLYVWFSWVNEFQYTEKIEPFNEWLRGIYVSDYRSQVVQCVGGGEWEGLRYMTISHISEAALTYTVISVIAILVLMNQIKKQRIENVDILIPGKIIRGIFIVGVGVCSGCVLKDGFQGIIGQMLVDYSVVSSIMIFIIGGIIGGMIALKIARTGLKKRKEVL